MDGYATVVDLPQHTYVYISPIQYWIGEVCGRTCQFGKQFDDVLHAYDIPSNPPILRIHVGFHFLKNVSLLWLITKDEAKNSKVDQMLRWLHWIFDFTYFFFIILRVGK